MKRLLTTILFIAFVSTSANTANAQINAFTGTIGILNPKFRLQYEGAISKRMSLGGEMTYYFVNWTGPKFEFFTRLYGNKPSKGFFFQGKVGIGTLKNIDYHGNEDYIANKRFYTYGGGIAGGYKIKATRHFIIEGLVGLQIYTPPYDNLKSGANNSLLNLGNAIGWYVTTGLPLYMELKFGYQYKKKHITPPPSKEEIEESNDSNSDVEAADEKETKEDKDKKDKKEK